MTVAFNSDVNITVRVAFVSAPLTGTPTWTDVSAYVRGFTTRRGRSHELDTVQAGTATILFDNLDGRFDPTYTSGAYYPNVLPMKQVNIRATYNSVTYDLFYGHITAWPQDYPNRVDHVVAAEAVDGFRILNAIYTETAESQEASGTRIGNLLDDASWPAGWRDLATGDVTVMAYTPSCQQILGLIQQVEETEGGLFFIAGDGAATLQQRSYRTGLSTVATFGDGGGAELGYSDIRLGYDDTQIWNRIEVGRQDGGVVAAEDATSIAAYAQRTLKKHDLLFVDDTASTALAQTLRTRYKDPHVRVDSITVQPRSAPSTLWPQALGRELSDKVTVKRRPPAGHTVTVDAYIEGVAHQVDASTRSWSTTFNLSQYD